MNTKLKVENLTEELAVVLAIELTPLCVESIEFGDLNDHPKRVLRGEYVALNALQHLDLDAYDLCKNGYDKKVRKAWESFVDNVFSYAIKKSNGLHQIYELTEE